MIVIESRIDVIPQGFAIIEYMNHPDFIVRFNLARTTVREQLSVVEDAWAGQGWHITGITEWWDVFLDDYMDQLQTRVRVFTDDATVTAFAQFNTAHGQQLTQYQRVRTTLVAWQAMELSGQGLTFDPQYFLLPRQPDDGNGGGGDGGDGDDDDDDDGEDDIDDDDDE